MGLRLIISLIFLLNMLNGIQKKAGAARSCIAGNTDLLHKRLMEMSEDQPGKGLEMIIGCNSVDSAAIRFNQICDFACGSMRLGEAGQEGKKMVRGSSGQQKYSQRIPLDFWPQCM